MRIAALAIVAALVVMPAVAQDAPKAAHDVYVEVPTVLAPESKAAARVVVVETKGVNKVKPLGDASVEIDLHDKTGKVANLYSGKTDAKGAADASFTVPKLADGDYTIEIRTKSGVGEDTQRFAAKIQREYRILLVSDKPLYQPGQQIRMRALALDPMTMRALGEQPISFEIEDAKGNKVFKRADKTNAYGIANVDFQLADEVIMGDYKVTANVAGQKSEKTVTVRKYVLPKFKLAVKTDKPFYMPKEKVKGTVQADYFFGKPVKGELVVKAATFDVALREFATTRVKTDEKGSAEFEIQLPEYFVGQPLDKGNAFLQVEATLTDSADHAETVVKTASVCNQPLLIGAVAESGKIVPGIENIVYVLAASPDGAPVEADVTLKTPKQEIKGRTNESGFAALRLTPKEEELQGQILNVAIEGKDKQGNEAKRTQALSSEYGKDQILLRPGAAIAKVGEKLALDVFGTFESTIVYLDVVRRGQTILTTTCDLAKGKGRYELPLTPDLFGSLEVHAYAFMGDAQIVRDSRIVFVQPAEDLKIDVSADKDTYLPGAESAISFRVTDAAGKGVQSALGVIVVDESVYALQEMQPGLEKIYFMLQKELMAPKIEIKWGGGSVAGALERGGKPEEEARRKETAIVLLAPVVLPERKARANTMQQRVAQMHQKMQQIYTGLQNYIAGQKGKFWVETGGKRSIDPNLLETVSGKGQLPKEMLVDPWGNKLTIGDLGGLNQSFTFEYWARLMSAQNIEIIFAKLVEWAAKNDPTAADVLERMAKAGALAPEQVKDYFGDPITMEKLEKVDAAFSKENLRKIADSTRRHHIFNRLMELAGKDRIITAEHAYVADAMAKAGDFVRPDGKPYDLAALAKENAAFSAANIAKIASVSQRAAIYNGLAALAQKGGFDKIAEFDGKAWTFRKDVLRTLVAEKILTEGQTADIAGRPFDLEQLAREDAQFSSQRVGFGILRGAADRIGNSICQTIHKGREALPADPIGVLIEKKAIKAEEANDPWGTQYKLVALRPGVGGQMPCGLLSGKFTLMSAGPDRKFDTADDVNVGLVQPQRGYQANYGGCVFYQPDPQIRHLTVAYDEELEDAVDGRWDHWRRKLGEEQLRGEGGGAGGRFGGRAGEPPRAPAPGAMAPVAEKAKMAKEDKKGFAAADHNESEDDGGGAARVREYFPETLAWKPSIITDADGRAQLALTMADSITTWRLTASANTVDGRLGSTTAPLLVFQDFFVDIDLPVSLTQGDVVSVPVAVYNYLKEKQTVTLTFAKSEAFELRDDAEKSIAMEPGGVKVVYYRVRAKGLGAANKIEIHARGSKNAKDAIVRSVEIVPDGKMVETVFNGQLSGEVRHTVTIPPNAVEGASKILFKAYPGVFASVLDGLDGMLRMPGG